MNDDGIGTFMFDGEINMEAARDAFISFLSQAGTPLAVSQWRQLEVESQRVQLAWMFGAVFQAAAWAPDQHQPSNEARTYAMAHVTAFLIKATQQQINNALDEVLHYFEERSTNDEAGNT